jgi:hypothetical protein
VTKGRGRSPDVAGRRRRLVALCGTLPEAEAELAGARHVAFKVRKKGYYLTAPDASRRANGRRGGHGR